MIAKVMTILETMLVIMKVTGLKMYLDSLILSVEVGLPKSITKLANYKIIMAAI